MTPEEAKPHVFRYASTQGQPGDVQLEKETGERMPIGTPFLTAKDTAEIAHAYARAIAAESRMWFSADQDKHEASRAELMAWRDKFEEWSK